MYRKFIKKMCIFLEEELLQIKMIYLFSTQKWTLSRKYEYKRLPRVEESLAYG